MGSHSRFLPPASPEQKRLLRALERREVTGSNPASHHGNRIKEGRAVKEKLYWEEGCAVLHRWRKVRWERHPSKDALLSHPAFTGGNDLLGVGAKKKPPKPLPAPGRRRRRRGRKRGRKEVGSSRACPAERKRQRSRSVQGAFPRAGSARSRGPDKGAAH